MKKLYFYCSTNEYTTTAVSANTSKKVYPPTKKQMICLTKLE